MLLFPKSKNKFFILLQIFTGNLHLINPDVLGYWLCERQLPSGGLNGRPEKLPDVCYSWWVLSSLYMIGRSHWMDKGALKKFILACQVGIVERISINKK